MLLYYYSLILQNIVNLAYSYKTYASLTNIVFGNMVEEPEIVVTEYYYGSCSAHKTMKRVFYKFYKYEDVQGKMIIQEELNATTFECVQIRALANFEDIIKYHTSKIALCFVVVKYQYHMTVNNMRYLEWFLPTPMRPNINWELFAYVFE